MIVSASWDTAAAYLYVNQTTGTSSAPSIGRTTGDSYTILTDGGGGNSQTFSTVTDSDGVTSYSSYSDSGTATTTPHYFSSSVSASRRTQSYISAAVTSAATGTTILTSTSAITAASFFVSGGSATAVTTATASTTGTASTTITTAPTTAASIDYGASSATASTSTYTLSSTTSVVGASAPTYTAAIPPADVYNTIFLFESSRPQVLWLPTAALGATGPLTAVAQSYSTDFTLWASDFFSSTSGTLATSSTTFPTTSFHTSSSSSFTCFDPSEPTGTSEYSPATARQYYLATFAVPSTTIPVFASYGTISRTTSYSIGVTVNGLSTFTTSSAWITTIASTVLTTFTANDLALDVGLTDGGFYIGRGSRTTTIPVFASTTIGVTSCQDTLSDTILVAGSSAAGAFSYTHWAGTFKSLQGGAVGPIWECYLPTAISGFAPFGTAGELSSYYQNITASLDSILAPYAFFLGDEDEFLNPALSFALARQASVFLRDYAQTFTLFYQTPDGESEGAATLQFSTSTGATDATLLVAMDDSVSGTMTVGFDTPFALADQSGQQISGPQFAGGCQYVPDKSATRHLFAGLRRGTTIDSAGGSSTGATNRVTTASEALATDQVIFESAIPLYSIASESYGATYLVSNLFQTNESAYP
jgi:hypothetical protein